MTAWVTVLLYLAGGLVAARALVHRQIAAGGLAREFAHGCSAAPFAHICHSYHGGRHVVREISWPIVGGVAAVIALAWPIILVGFVTLVWRRPPTPTEAAAYRQRIADLERQLGIN